MSVQYRFLDQFRPSSASFGEVVSITVIRSFGHGLESIISSSKRKSIHVPPSANAYWNYMNLTRSVSELLRDSRYRPDDVRRLRKEFVLAIGNIHLYALQRAYGTVCTDGTFTAPDRGVAGCNWETDCNGQYFDLVLCDNRMSGCNPFWDGWLVRPASL